MSTERITYRPEGARARTNYLTDVQATSIMGAECITGMELNREGDSVIREGDRRHIIQAALVIRRTPVVMDKIYGEYVDA